MQHILFNTTTGKRIFEINTKSYPLPRVGEKVSYNREHYIVESVKHRFADIEGPESTGIVITLSFDPEMVYPATTQKLIQGEYGIC